MKIGFIGGNGFVGRHCADDFEARGYTVVRYDRMEPFNENKEAIRNCDVVFVVVPAPTTPQGYDVSIVRGVLPLTGVGKIIVLKSTMLPGLTEKIQEEFPDRIVMHSPEFLSEPPADTSYEAAHPFVNILGLTKETSEHRKAAELVHSILPKAPANFTMKSTEAEIFKYTHNCHGYTQLIFINLMYDLAQKIGADWEPIKEALKVDPFVSNKYITPMTVNGRGAGGSCFIKDFAAFREIYEKAVADPSGISVLKSMEKKNMELLLSTNKSVDLLKGVYNISKYRKNAEK